MVGAHIEGAVSLDLTATSFGRRSKSRSSMGDDRRHTKCTCSICSGGRTTEPHTDTSSDLLSQTEVDHLNSGDWSQIAALYNIHAPLSVCRSQEAIAASTEPTLHLATMPR